MCITEVSLVESDPPLNFYLIILKIMLGYNENV
jgi:hypothetical protein